MFGNDDPDPDVLIQRGIRRVRESVRLDQNVNYTRGVQRVKKSLDFGGEEEK